MANSIKHPTSKSVNTCNRYCKPKGLSVLFYFFYKPDSKEVTTLNKIVTKN